MRIVQWIRVGRKSPNTETLPESQIIRSTAGLNFHVKGWVDPPFNEKTTFILDNKIFFSYNVKRNNAHRSIPLIKLVEYLKTIDPDREVWICPVSLDRLGNDDEQLDAIHDAVTKAHKNASIKPLREFGIPFDVSKAHLCGMVGNRAGTKSKRGVVVAEGKRDERMKVKDNAKNIYNELKNGDKFWGKIIQDGIEHAGQSPPCPTEFQENWMAFLNDEGEGGDLITQLNIVGTESSSSSEGRGIGVYLRSSPDSTNFMMHGIPVHQISFVLGDLLHQYDGKDAVAKLNIHIFYDHHQSGYKVNNPEFMKFLNLHRLGRFDESYFPSTTRPSRREQPVLSIIEIGEHTNTTVRFSMNIGEDVKQLTAGEEKRWSENKKAHDKYEDDIDEARKNLPTEAGEGRITQNTSSEMAKIRRKRVTNDVRTMYAEQLKSCEFVEDSDLMNIPRGKSMDTWNDDGDESSIESIPDEDEEGEENGEDNLQDDDDMIRSTKKRRRNTEEDGTEEADEDNENNNADKGNDES